jgi:uncharacterized membrane protein
MSTSCPSCGIAVNENLQHFCGPKPSVVPGAEPPIFAQTPAVTSFPPTALAPNIAGALAYAAGFLSGIAFLVLEPYKQDRYVRFHAWQSILFSLAWIAFWIPWSILSSILLGGMAMTNPGFAVGRGLPLIALFLTAVSRLLGFAGFALWLFLLYKAHSSQQFKIPLIGEIASSQAGCE